jgi:formylglycine-generating enzyme required for sulfatase activity
MTQTPKPLFILSDQPAAEDQLNFDPYARTLADIIADGSVQTPLTIGVFGSWGSGKTSLMTMVKKQLDARQQEVRRAGKRLSFCPHLTVWFNAWLYSQEQALWRALILHVLAEVRRARGADPAIRQELDRLEGQLQQVAAPMELGSLSITAADLLSEEGTGSARITLDLQPGLDLLEKVAQALPEGDLAATQALRAQVRHTTAALNRERVEALERFREQFKALVAKAVVPHGFLVVFVDDLDRCLPEKAVEVLEAIRLFFDVPGCIFCLGIDREVIERGIRLKYREYEQLGEEALPPISGARYLEKIVQIPFLLPPIDREAMQNYVHDTVPGLAALNPCCETVFAVGVEPNPRRIKRTLNIFVLLWRLAQNREDLKDIIKPVRLAKIVVIQQYHPRLFKLITAGPHYLIDLEERFRGQERPALDAQESPLTRERERVLGGEGPEGVSAGPLSEFLGRSLLRDLLTCTAPDEPEANFADLTPAGVREYIYLTRSAVEEPAREEEAAPLPFEPQMVAVPAGAFLMGTPESELDELVKLGADRDWIQNEVPQHQVELAAYAVGRYPVTNAEYARFIEDGGYRNPDFWTDAGWRQKESEGWTQPRFWEDEAWNAPSQPVVGVSWYEAVAYCNWLAAKTGKPYRLPTEAEWEKTARGTDGRRYPWGNQWDAGRCNNKESGPGRTTPVGEYPDGEGPYGGGDMVGQVWEWCRTKWGGTGSRPEFGYPYRSDDGREDLEGDEIRVLRGGSWVADNPAAVCRCGFRDGYDPWYWSLGRGFRCARTLSS